MHIQILWSGWRIQQITEIHRISWKLCVRCVSVSVRRNSATRVKTHRLAVRCWRLCSDGTLSSRLDHSANWSEINEFSWISRKQWVHEWNRSHHCCKLEILAVSNPHSTVYCNHFKTKPMRTCCCVYLLLSRSHALDFMNLSVNSGISWNFIKFQ